MNDVQVIHIAQQTVFTAFIIALPLLGGSLVIGLAIGIFQAVTQIQEMTLTFVPKILIVGVILFVTFPWILNQVVKFVTNLLSIIHTL